MAHMEIPPTSKAQGPAAGAITITAIEFREGTPALSVARGFVAMWKIRGCFFSSKNQWMHPREEPVILDIG